MATRLPRNTDQARDQLAEAEWADAMSERERRRAVDSAQALGAVRATITIAKALSRGGFAGLRQFIEDEEFKSLGYATVVEFFASGDSPMTKNQYYDRLNALEREGDQVFELLNAMKIPLSNRKLLAAGEIRIDGEEVVLGHEDREERVPITDRFAIKTLIATLAEKQEQAEQRAAVLDKKIKRGEKDVEKYKRQVDEARRTGGSSTISTPHAQALLTLVGAYSNLRAELAAYREAITPGSEEDERFNEFWRTVIDTIGAQYVELSEAAGMTGPLPDVDEELPLEN